MLLKQYNALSAPEVSHAASIPGTERSSGTKITSQNAVFGFIKYVFGFCRKLQFNVKRQASTFLSNENNFN